MLVKIAPKVTTSKAQRIARTRQLWLNPKRNIKVAEVVGRRNEMATR